MRTTDRKPGKYAKEKQDAALTEKKYKELSDALIRAKSKRPILAAEVRRLAELGDFSENVEYQLAKGKLRGLNNSIRMLEHQLSRAEIIHSPKQTERVEIGHSVTVETNGKRKHYTILGSAETNPERGVISRNSPIGAALMGRRAGETVTITLANKKEISALIISIE